MSRKLELYQVYYRLRHDNVLRFRFCLAFNHCHSVQVLLRSLTAEDIELADIIYESTDYIKTYR